MLNGQQGVFLREVEHVEDYVLVTIVLAVVDGVHHFYNGLAFMNNLCLAVKSDDGQFALHQYAVIHSGVVVPAQFLAGREYICLLCANLNKSTLIFVSLQSPNIKPI